VFTVKNVNTLANYVLDGSFTLWIYLSLPVKRVIPILLAILVVTNILTVAAWQSVRSHTAQVDPLLSKRQEHPLLAKRLFVQDPNDVIVNFSPLRDALNQYFEQNVPARYSFYFEYMPTGTSIRINSNEELVGASLLKLPVVMNLYKAVELGKVRLDQPVALKAEWLDNQFGTVYQRGAGARLTYQELAEHVLRESDNTSANAISATVTPLLTDDDMALSELDVPYTITKDKRTDIGAQSYTSLLKCLYFSCFVSEEHSQAILELMSEAPHEGRIGAGLPDDVTVAHKIGTFSNNTESDCGIVYLDSRNYTVCMLVELPSAQANQHIKIVSSLIYQYLSTQ
jgi:beta-lactamase class A